MRLILLSSEGAFPNENAILKKLFDGGLEKLHVRKPHFKKNELARYIENLSPQHYSKIVLHTHHDLVAQYGLGGMHYNTRSPFEKAPLQNSLTHSISCHSLQEIEIIQIPAFHYCFLSPVFTSISKPDYPTNPEFEKLQGFLIKHPDLPPVIALGGVDENNIKKAACMGFKGVAVLGAVWQKAFTLPDIVKKYEALQRLCQLSV